MIHLGQITKVEFGKEQKGTISVSNNHTTLFLQELAKDKNIGDNLEAEDIKELPNITMDFSYIDYLQKMIKDLNYLKDNFDYLKNHSIVFDNFPSDLVVRLNDKGVEKSLIKYEMVFYKKTSILVVITVLKAIERNWTAQYQYALAC